MWITFIFSRRAVFTCMGIYIYTLMDNFCLYVYILGMHFALTRDHYQTDKYDVLFVVALGFIIMATQSLYDFLMHPWNVRKIKQWITEYALVIFSCNFMTLYVQEPMEFVYLFYVYLFHNIIFTNTSFILNVVFSVFLLGYILLVGPVISLFPSIEGIYHAHYHVMNLMIYHVALPFARGGINWVMDFE